MKTIKRLYDPNSRFNALGMKVDSEVKTMLMPFIKKHLDDGVDAVDLEHIINNAFRLDLLLEAMKRPLTQKKG